jgi:hypothetical protein
MRALVSLFVLAALASSASAQILKIEFKDPKKAKNYKDNCIEVNEELILVGEAKSGIELKLEENKITYSPKTNELWVTDMNNPKVCPYKVDAKGEKQRGAGKCVISINGDDIKNIQVFMKDQSFWGMSKEYARRDDEIDDLKKQRDASHKGTREWKDRENAVIQAMERMKSWLEETLYKRAAKRVAKEIDAESKAAKEANAQRLALAKASIKLVATPDDLTKVAKECWGDAISFHTQESMHVRMVYREDVGDERVKSLMELAENLIDGFRVSFVDPYVSDDFKDYVPDDKMFAEYFFGPDEMPPFENFCKKYYGHAIAEGAHRDEMLKMTGFPFHRGTAPAYVNPSRTKNDSDFEGIVTHQMGHWLVNLHYNQDRMSDVADWLYEGVGNWLSLEYLGRNTVQCVQFRDLEYAKKLKGQTGETNLLKGTADLYHRLALDKGPTVDQLALKKLAQFEDEDIAKAFSFFSFIAKMQQGEKGQRFLRACCNAGGVQGFLQQWRKKADEIFGVSGADVFKKVEDDWKKYAEVQIGGPLKK